MIKERLKNILTKIKNNKKKVIGVTIVVFAAFIFTFTVYNLNNPTKINRLFANVLNNGKPVNDAFEDNTFYSCVVDTYNSNHQDNKKAYTDNLTDEELASITSLNCSSKNIEDTSGIEKITNLAELDLTENELANIDLSSNILLTNLNLTNNKLTSIDLSNNTSITYIKLRDNLLTNIDLTKNLFLTYLSLRENQIENIDLSKNENLNTLYIDSNKLTNINLDDNKLLTDIDLSNNQLTSVNLSNNTALTDLNLGVNQLTNIDLSQNVKLELLELFENMLSDVNLSTNSVLRKLDLENNKLQSVDIKNNTLLTYLYLSNNDLTNIDLTNNLKLNELSLENTKIERLDLSKNTELNSLYTDDTPLKEDILMQAGETYQIEEKIVPPEGQNITYSISDTSVATIEGNTITAQSEGSTTLTTKFGNVSFNRKLAVGKIVLSSDDDDTIINEEEKYIYVKKGYLLNYNDSLSESLSTNFGQIVRDNDIIKVVSGNKTYLEYKLVYFGGVLNRDNYFLLYSSNQEPDKYNIDCINCTYEFLDNNGKISIKYNNKEIDNKNVIYIYLPFKYRIINGNLIVFDNIKIDDYSDKIKTINNINEIEKDKINVLNYKVKYQKFENEPSFFGLYNDLNDENYIANFWPYSLYSKNYDLSNKFIYVGTEEFKNDLRFIFNNEELNLERPNDGLIITSQSVDFYDGDVLRCNWDLIKVTSDKYDMSGDTINLGNEDIDLTKINVTNATLKKEDNKLLIMYGDEVVKEFKLEGGKKTTTTTKKNDEKPTATKDKTTTKKEVKATKKKVSIIDKIFGNKETTTTKKEETTTKKNIFRKSTTTKVENSSGNATSNNKNSFKKLVTGSNLLILFLSITGIALIIYIIIDKKKNKFNN